MKLQFGHDFDADGISIGKLYDEVAGKLSDLPADYRYDCTKITCGKGIYELVKTFYNSNYKDPNLAFGMDWLCYGPKLEEKLQPYEIEVLDGFIKEV